MNVRWAPYAVRSVTWSLCTNSEFATALRSRTEIFARFGRMQVFRDLYQLKVLSLKQAKPGCNTYMLTKVCRGDLFKDALSY